MAAVLEEPRTKVIVTLRIITATMLSTKEDQDGNQEPEQFEKVD